MPLSLIYMRPTPTSNGHAEHPETATTLGRHIPALDGFRGLAIMMVLLCHFGWGTYTGRGPLVAFFGVIVSGGWVGVDLFFVLSGYLITGILLDTLDTPRYFQKFYTRRALRIFPVYYAVLLVFLLLTPALKLNWNGSFPYLLVYLTNYISVARLNLHGSHILIDLTHFWSLAVEEQFYLVWPFVVWWAGTAKRLKWVAIAVILVAPIARVVAHSRGLDTLALYLWTPFRADSLAWGGLMAVTLRLSRRQSLVRIAYVLMSLGGVSVVVICWARGSYFLDIVNDTAGFSALGAFFAGLLVLIQQPKFFLHRFFILPPLRWIGKYSYGIYIYHYLFVNYVIPPRRWVVSHTHSVLIGVVVAELCGAGFAIAAAYLSFELYEKRWLRLKQRLAPNRQDMAELSRSPVTP